MPTTLKRHTVTETPDVARALDVAAARWPGVPRSQLLVRLINEGAQAVDDEREDRLARRLAGLRRASGALTGVYPPGYLEELRKDWPE